jgi:hypothetical protein
MTPESEAEKTSAEPKDTGLPGVSVLFSSGWQYAVNNLALVGILSVPFVVRDILTYLGAVSTGPLFDSSGGVLALVNFAALLVYVLLITTALYLVTHQSQTPVFADGFTWARRHFWSIVWISILTGLVVGGGFLLLLVPGIIAATYIALSQIVLAAEGKQGVSALMRSRELVYGNWWAVVGRMLGVQLMYFVVILAIGLIVGVGLAFFANELLSEFITNILFTVLGSAGTLIFLSVTYEMYTALKITKESAPPVFVPAASKKYQALAWFGLLAPIIIGGLVMLAVQTNDFSTAPDSPVADTVLVTELKLLQSQSDLYYSKQPEPSFIGVCRELQSLISGDGEVVCNESPGAYALSIQQTDTLLCVDSTGYNKIMYTDLGERTQCLDV